MDRRQLMIVLAFATLAIALVAPAVLLPRSGTAEDPLAAGSVHPAPPFDDLPESFTARMEAAVSGDTWRVITPEGARCVRLLGIDSPEPDQPHWLAARIVANRMAGESTLQVRISGINTDHCLTGQIFSGEQDFGLALVEAGMAWFNGDMFEGSGVYAAAQKSAREKKIGIWAEADPVPPWERYNAWQKQLDTLAANASSSGATDE